MPTIKIDSNYESFIIAPFKAIINPFSDIKDDNNLIGSNSNIASSSKTIISNYNKGSYKLELDKKSKAYIFRNKLFKRTLLPLDPSKDREMLLTCTI